jgi:dihydrolipoamide dehydrogenase
VRIDVEHNGKKETLDGDYVLVSVGRRPSLTGVDAKALGIATGRRGEITVDDQMRTNLPNVFAIGDAIGGKLLAHKAEEEGVVAAEVIAGKPARMHYRSIPSVVYTWPEVASVGLSEEEAKQSGREYRVGKFPFSANGRARTSGETDGFVKIIRDAKYGEILGAHIIGPHATEIIHELVVARENEYTVEEIDLAVHAHPTLAEAVAEAALDSLGRVIHV